MLRSILQIVLISFGSGFTTAASLEMLERFLRMNTSADVISTTILTACVTVGYGLGSTTIRQLQKKNITFRTLWLMYALLFVVTFYAIYVTPTLISPFAKLLRGNMQLAVIALQFLLIFPISLLAGSTFSSIFFISGNIHSTARYALYTLGTGIGYLSLPFFLKDFSVFYAGAGCIGSCLLLSILYSKKFIFETTADTAVPRIFVPIILSASSGILSLLTISLYIRWITTYLVSSHYGASFIFSWFYLISGLASLFWTSIVTRYMSALRIVQLLLLGTLFSLLLLPYIRTQIPSPNLPLFTWVVVGFFVLFPSFFQGGIFAVLISYLSEKRKNQIPLLTFINAIAGVSILTFSSFVVIPFVGVYGLFILSYVVIGICLILLNLKKSLKQKISLGIPVIFIVTLFINTPHNLFEDFSLGPSIYPRIVQEGPSGSAVVALKGEKMGDVLVNGQYMSFIPTHPRHVTLGIHILALPQITTVAQLGLGGGGLSNQILVSNRVSHLTVVDWSWELPKLLSKQTISPLVGNIISDPRVTVETTDARTFLATTSKTFDIIVDNLAVSNWPGATVLRTKEYFINIKNKLSPHGVYVLEVNAHTKEAFDRILVGVNHSFKYMYQLNEVLLASNRPILYSNTYIAQVLERWQPESDLPFLTIDEYKNLWAQVFSDPLVSPVDIFNLQHEFKRFNDIFTF